MTVLNFILMNTSQKTSKDYKARFTAGLYPLSSPFGAGLADNNVSLYFTSSVNKLYLKNHPLVSQDHSLLNCNNIFCSLMTTKLVFSMV